MLATNNRPCSGSEWEVWTRGFAMVEATFPAPLLEARGPSTEDLDYLGLVIVVPA